MEYTDLSQNWYRVFSDQGPFEPYLVTAMQMRRSIKKKEMIFAVKVKEVEDEDREIEMLNKYPVLRKYKDVFPKELLGLPPKWEFDFSIDLVPGA